MEGTVEIVELDENGKTVTRKIHRILLSEPNKIEFWDMTSAEWQILISACKLKGALTIKDITILRLYATFMQLSFVADCKDNNERFLKEFRIFLLKQDANGLCKALDPENKFNCTEQNRVQIKELLVDLQKSKAIVGEENGESPEKIETEQVTTLKC